MTRDTWQRLKSDRYGMGGLVVVAAFALIAVCVWGGLLGQGWSDVSWQPLRKRQYEPLVWHQPAWPGHPAAHTFRHGNCI